MQLLEKSKKLEELLSNLHLDFGKLQTKVDAIFEQGRKENFTDKDIGKLIRKEMKVAGYSAGTITRVFDKYPEAIFEWQRRSGRPPVAKSATKRLCPRCREELEEDEEQEPEVSFQIKPEEYMIEDVPKYDKPLLVKIVKFLDKNIASLSDSTMKWDKQIHDLTVENKELKAKLKEIKN
jgi:hypothetical protein